MESFMQSDKRKKLEARLNESTGRLSQMQEEMELMGRVAPWDDPIKEAHLQFEKARDILNEAIEYNIEADNMEVFMQSSIH